MADNNTRIVLTAVDQTQEAIRSATAGINTLKGAIESMPGFGGIAASLGALASGAAIKTQIADTLAWASGMQDLAEKTGASVENLAGVSRIAKVAGIDMGVVEQGMIRLTKAMAGGDEAAKGAGRALESLGLKSAALRSMDTADALKTVADAMAKYADGSGKTALALDVFGKQGAQLLPMMKELAESASIQGKLTTAQADAAKELEKSWRKLNMEGGTFAKSLVIDMMPALASLIDLVTDVKEVFTGMSTGLVVAAKSAATFGSVALSAAGGGFTEEGRAKIKQEIAEWQRFIAAAQEDVEKRQKAAEQRQTARARVDLALAGGKPELPKLNYTSRDGKDEKDPYDAIKKKAEDFIKTLEKETAQLGLNVQQRKMIEAAMIAGTLRTEAEQKAVMAAAGAWAEKSESLEKAAAAARENNRIVDMFIEQEDRERVAVEHGIKSLREYVDKLDEETFALTATSAQLREHIILREMERSGLEKTSDAYAEMEKRMRASMSANEIAKDVKAAADKSRQEWENFTRDIEQSLTDALMRGFENGNSFGENFVKTLKHTLETAALKVAVQAVVNPIMNSIGGAVGGGGSGGGMGLPGIPGGGLYGAFATSDIGASLGLSAASDFTGALTLTESGLAIGSALPWVGGALALASMSGMFDGEGDAMRSGRFFSPFAGSNAPGSPMDVNLPDGSRYNWLNNSWFSADMQPELDKFDASLQAMEQGIIDKLKLSGTQIASINERMLSVQGEKRYNFGMEHTSVSASGVFDQIEADRMQTIAEALGMSLKDLQDQMSGAAKTAKDLADESARLAAEQNKARAQALLAGMGATLGAIDSVTGLRSGILSSIAGIRGGNSYDSRMSGLQALLAGETDIGRQVELAGQMKDLVIERYQTERSAIQANQSAAEEAAAAMRAGLISIGAYARSLLLSDLSPLTAAQRLAESENQFNTTLMRARQGDASAIGSLSGAAGTYLQESRGYYASSQRYSDVFGSVQGALAQLGLSADSVTATGDWQAQLLAVDNAAADRLGELAGFTEEWTLNLENLLVDQTRQFEGLGLKLTDVADNTRGLDQRIAVLIDTALGARFDKLATAVEKSAATTARAVVNAVQVTVRS